MFENFEWNAIVLCVKWIWKLKEIMTISRGNWWDSINQWNNISYGNASIEFVSFFAATFKKCNNKDEWEIFGRFDEWFLSGEQTFRYGNVTNKKKQSLIVEFDSYNQI